MKQLFEPVKFGGLDEGQSLEICRMLSNAGIDSIEVSGNGTSVGGVRPHRGEGYLNPPCHKAWRICIR